MKVISLISMSLGALRTNKLRSALTLLGIVAGVASIIAVMTGVAVVQSTIESELSVLGTTVFQAQKWPAGGMGNDQDWREIMKRKPITVEQADIIREKARLVDLVGAELWNFGFTARYRGETAERLTICGGTPEYAPNNSHYIIDGRNITQADTEIGRRVVVIGHNVAQTLFPFTDPLGKNIKLDGIKYQVIGIFEEKKSSMGGGYDNYCLIPISQFIKAYGLKNSNGDDRSVNVTMRAISATQLDNAIEEVRGILRVARKVRAQDNDDFTIFTNVSQIKQFNEATAGVKVGAFVIGIIALVVAGIGIMNIMLVSVTERTREIGIRKALGAKRKNILAQFLLEAIVLCNVGGIIGIVVGFALGNMIIFFTDFSAVIPLEWVLGGLLFCSSVGIVFGLWPAVIASRLDPIEALRFE